MAHVASGDGQVAYSPEIVGLPSSAAVASYRGGLILLTATDYRSFPFFDQLWAVHYVSDAGIVEKTVELGRHRQVAIAAVAGNGALVLKEGYEFAHQNARLISVTQAGVQWSQSERSDAILSVAHGSDGSVGYAWVKADRTTTPPTVTTGVAVLDTHGSVRWTRPAALVFPNVREPLAGCLGPPLVADTAGHLVVSSTCSGDPQSPQWSQPEVAVLSLTDGQTLLEQPVAPAGPLGVVTVDTGRLYVGRISSTIDSPGHLHAFDVPMLTTQLALPKSLP